MSCSVCRGYDSSKCPCCSEELNSIECPDCHGSGFALYFAFNVKTRETIEVSEEEWETLPDDEDSAIAKGVELIQCEEGGTICRTCHGEGKIPEGYSGPII